MSKPQVGDVLRIDQLTENDTFNFNPPLWGIVTREPIVMIPIDLIVRHEALVAAGWRDEKDESRDLLVEFDRDKFDVIPPDDWPDEVCAAVAEYRLTGSVG